MNTNPKENSEQDGIDWWAVFFVSNILGLISFNTLTTWLLPIALVGIIVSFCKIFG